MGNERIYTLLVDGAEYDVYGCWDQETPEGEYDFYEIYGPDRVCLNLGEMLFERPTAADVREFLSQDPHV